MTEPPLRDKIDGLPLYRWSHVRLIEHRQTKHDSWLKTARPHVRLDPGVAGWGLVLDHQYATIYGSVRTRYVSYRVPAHNLVASTRFEVVDRDGLVHAAGGDEIVCDGAVHATLPILHTEQTHVVLEYACSQERPRHCLVCGELEAPAARCDRLFFGPSF